MKNLISLNICYLYFLVLFSLLPATLPAQEKLLLAEIFQDNMVLQREAEISVWGSAPSGAPLELNFMGQTWSTTADTSGTWGVTLPAVTEPGGTHTMTIQSAGDRIQVNNIMIGDVWLCSGQSNMEWPLRHTDDAKQEIEQYSNRQIRHFKIPKSSALRPSAALPSTKGWEPALPENTPDFTAVGYYFAKHIHKSQSVPVGLINSTWGGSHIVAWMGYQTLGYDSEASLEQDILNRRETLKQRQKNQLLKKLDTLTFEEDGLTKDGQYLWKSPDMDDAQWKEMTLPTFWEWQGLDGLDGIVWFRKSIDLPSSDISADSALLSLGSIDDSDMVWVNGHYVGGMKDTWNVHRYYSLPMHFLKPGKNVIAIRVTDKMQRGGFRAEDDDMYLTLGEKKVSLSGPWRYKVAQVFEDNLGKMDHKMPSLLFNKMIYPLHRFPIKGVIWYQGESDANAKNAYEYRNRFKTLINHWRSLWNQRDLPFLYVQLTGFKEPKPTPQDSHWAVVRESQSEALKLSNTAQAVIVDLGDTHDIHPRNKKDVGYRLGLAAEKLAYGREIVYSGPAYRKHEVDGQKITLHFDHVGSGLIAKGNTEGRVNSFAIASEDGTFYPAEAIIKNHTVEVWSDKVKEPVAVRYAWADNPVEANLYNQEGLPASPFRTDE